MPENITPNRRKARADVRSPFVFDVRDVERRAGSMREYRRSVPAPAGLGQEIIGVPEGAPLVLDIRLESVTEGVLVTGNVSGPLRGECGRCLGPVSEDFAVDVCELFAYPDSATDETTEQDEVRRLEKDLLDLEPVVRDLVVLGLPWTPLCKPDCAGLCPNCGERLDDLPAGHSHEVLDPRWAALASFTDSGTPADAAASETPPAPVPAPSDQPD